MQKKLFTSSLAAITSFVFFIGAAGATTHEDFQAVYADGTSAYSGPDWVTLEGIILNSPEEILDPTASAPVFMGGQWQIYIQGEGADHAGTAIWMGQLYGNLPWIPPEGSYTDGEWRAELCRINHDPNTNYLFHPGDRVRVTGKYLFYNGKNNVNEQHDKNPANDFVIELLEAAAALPQPETVILEELKDPCDDFIFDQTRQTGCEYYQSRLIRINNVSFVNPAAWAPNVALDITDGKGRTFPVLLGIGAGIKPGANNLAPTFDIIGILDQECPEPHTGGYRIWVPNYDGNGLVLTDRGYRRGNLPGDINRDGVVNLYDLAELAGQWLSVVCGIGDCN